MGLIESFNLHLFTLHFGRQQVEPVEVSTINSCKLIHSLLISYVTLCNVTECPSVTDAKQSLQQNVFTIMKIQ